MTEFESLPRETGSEKSGKFCPDCGSELPAVVSAYGSVRPGVCSVCANPAAGLDQLQAQRAAADEDDDEVDEEEDDELEEL